MLTITPPEYPSQQHCEWLGPRVLERGIIQVRTNRHGLYSRTSNILRSGYVLVRPHTAICSITHNMLFVYDIFYGMERWCTIHFFDTKNKGEKQRSSYC